MARHAAPNLTENGARMIRFVPTLFLVPFVLLGSDPVVSLPKNYWVESETPLVRVVHVHYGPKEKLPEHDHPKTPTLYVYLSDAGPVRFKHTGTEAYALERAPVKLGGLRLNPGVIETHEVENLSEVSSDFLRVEFKGLPPHPSTLRGRVPPSATVLSGAAEVAFDDKHVRLVRFGAAPHQRIALPAPTSSSSIDIVIRASKGANSTHKPLHAGQAWKAVAETIHNPGDEPLELLRVELKSAP